MVHLFLFIITLLLHIEVLLLLIDVLLFAVQLEGIPHTGAFHFVSGPQGISDCINRRLDGSVDDCVQERERERERNGAKANEMRI